MLQIETITAENENLKQDLDATKEKMQGMISEFGNMFGGGSDHELTKHEVVDKMLGDNNKKEVQE